jgi:hypothetical protein
MEKILIASEAAHFTQEHILFGHSYMLEFEWIEREQFWVLHIYDGSENPIALGLRIAEGNAIFIDKTTLIVFWLMATKPNARLDFFTLRKDFVLMAETADALI